MSAVPQRRAVPSGAALMGAMVRVAAWGLLALVLLPVAAVMAGGLSAIAAGGDAGGTDLLRPSMVSLALVAIVTVLATAIGAGTAVLVAGWRFPGSEVFSCAMVLPLAAPAYIVAFAWADLTAPGRMLDILPVSGFGGAAFVLTFTLFPYAYLATRAALATQSVCALEAARTLGAGTGRRLGAVVLPMARPALVAGAALIAMETAAEYGTVSYFGVRTWSVEILREWLAFGDRAGAMQLASLLMLAAFAALLVERSARGRARVAGGSHRWRTPERTELVGPWRWVASAACAAPLLLGFVIPIAGLLYRASIAGVSPAADLPSALLNSLTLATLGGGLTIMFGLALAAAGRRSAGVARGGSLLTALGYSAPGVVVALGALTAFGWAREAGWVGGFVGALALGVLVWSYATRFTAAGLGQIEAGLQRVTPSLSGAARTLGAGAARRFFAVDLPIAAPATMAAALMVFVEIVKELPATLLLRPFDFDTLATRAYGFASDERLAQAAFPAALIALAGLVPVVALSRALGLSRPGTRTGALPAGQPTLARPRTLDPLATPGE